MSARLMLYCGLLLFWLMGDWARLLLAQQTPEQRSQVMPLPEEAKFMAAGLMVFAMIACGAWKVYRQWSAERPLWPADRAP